MDNTRGAAIFCSKNSFQAYLSARTGQNIACERGAAVALRDLCEVKSRRELNTNDAACGLYQLLIKDFSRWVSLSRSARPVKG